MSPEVIAILAVGVALAGIGLNAQRTARADNKTLSAEIEDVRTEFGRKIDGLQADINSLRDEMGSLRERMAKLEGLLEGLREAIAGRRDAA